MTPCIWHHFEQGTPEWLQARGGMATVSRMEDIAGVSKTGVETAKRRLYRKQLVAERMTGKPTFVYPNYAMRWGTENEAGGRAAYSDVKEVRVDIVGLAESTEIEFFGYSPDGLVGDNGLIEIKCPESATFVEWVTEGVVPEQHKPQMAGGLAITGREWCDFVAYDPRFPVGQDLFIRRYIPSVFEIQAIKNAARVFLDEVAAMEMRFVKARWL